MGQFRFERSVRALYHLCNSSIDLVESERRRVSHIVSLKLVKVFVLFFAFCVLRFVDLYFIFFAIRNKFLRVSLRVFLVRFRLKLNELLQFTFSIPSLRGTLRLTDARVLFHFSNILDASSMKTRNFTCQGSKKYLSWRRATRFQYTNSQDRH